MFRWLVCTSILVALSVSAPSTASADRIKTLSKRLSAGSSSKVRMSAALSLAKSDDIRAVQALSKALRSDGSATIRRISASSLGQRLQTQGRRPNKRSKKIRREAMAALKNAATKDKDRKVRSSAKTALAKVGQGASASPAPRRRGGKRKGILVGISKPVNLSKRLPRNIASIMQTTVKQVIDEKAPRSIKTSKGSKLPSSAILARSGMMGYSVVPNVSKLSLVKRGQRVLIQCEVKLRLSPWDGVSERWLANKTATVTGAGTVSSGKSKNAVSMSSQECISAVVGQVTASQVVPFLAQKAR